MSESTFRIAPRSAVATADTRLLRVARTEIVGADVSRATLVERLRSRLLPGGRGR